MTFSHLAPSVLQPDELKLVQGVFDRITSQRWFSQYPSRRADFARYVLTMYMLGPVFPEKLVSLCTLAARTHYITSDAHLGGRRILIVDDDYYTAKEAAEAERSGCDRRGALFQPVGRHGCRGPDTELDGALLDVDLNGEMVFPVAGFLRCMVCRLRL